MKIPRWLCRILTWGRHWNQYYPGDRFHVRCRLCGSAPDSLWDAYVKLQNQQKDPIAWANERRKKCGLRPL